MKQHNLYLLLTWPILITSEPQETLKSASVRWPSKNNTIQESFTLDEKVFKGESINSDKQQLLFKKPTTAASHYMKSSKATAEAESANYTILYSTIVYNQILGALKRIPENSALFAIRNFVAASFGHIMLVNIGATALVLFVFEAVWDHVVVKLWTRLAWPVREVLMLMMRDVVWPLVYTLVASPVITADKVRGQTGCVWSYNICITGSGDGLCGCPRSLGTSLCSLQTHGDFGSR